MYQATATRGFTVKPVSAPEKHQMKPIDEEEMAAFRRRRAAIEHSSTYDADKPFDLD